MLKKLIAMFSSIVLSITCVRGLHVSVNADWWNDSTYVVGADNVIYATGDNMILEEYEAPVGEIHCSKLLQQAVAENPDMKFAVQIDEDNFDYDVYEKQFCNETLLDGVTYTDIKESLYDKEWVNWTDTDRELLNKIKVEADAYAREKGTEIYRLELEMLQENGVELIMKGDYLDYMIVTAEQLQELPMNQEIGYKASLAMPSAGDVTMDAETDIIDVITINRVVVGVEQVLDVQRMAGDIDHNGVLDLSDSLLILQYTVGLVDDLDA
ncbi:MAG: hypothetical protein K2H29_03675 [Oscillospiraceae bacterium]|nr:hypothetical protein [Oscillospiraceae bacterium]MDE5884162.1 hypothetical protein [Oscillospiraceae bacterium]